MPKIERYSVLPQYFRSKAAAAAASLMLLTGCNQQSAESLSELETQEPVPEVVQAIQSKIMMLEVMPASTDGITSTVERIELYNGDTYVVGAGHGLVGGNKASPVDCNNADANIVHPHRKQVSSATTHYEVGVSYDAADISVLHLAGSGGAQHMPAIPIGPMPEFGDTVYSVGYNPEPLIHTNVARGEYIGDYKDTALIAQSTEDYIVAGNSGGPIVDAYGRAVAIAVSTSIGTFSVDGINKEFGLSLSSTPETDDKKYIVAQAVPIVASDIMVLGKASPTCNFH